MVPLRMSRLLRSSRFAPIGRFSEGAVSLVRNDFGAAMGALFLIVMVTLSVLAPIVAPYDPALQSLVTRLKPPVFFDGGSTAHLLGTDNLGRDVLSRLIYGARTSLFIACSVIVIAGGLGSFLGILAGYLGGRVDAVIMRIADTQIAFPGMLLALTVLAMIGPSVPGLILVLCLNEWMLFARVTRSATLSLKSVQFIEAAEMTGAGTIRVLFRHLMPNLAPMLLTLVMLEFANVLLAEAGLSFLGVGVQSPGTTWGLDISTGKQYIFNAWWLVTMPGLAIAFTVLAVNLVSNWIRVQTNPAETERQFASRQAAPTRFADHPAIRVEEPERSGVPSLLEVKNLKVEFATKRGAVHAIRGLDLVIKPGETIGIVGESGSGKSVTASAIMGLVQSPGRIVGGDILWEGKSVLSGAANPQKGKDIAMVFQDPMTSLDPLFTVGYQIEEVLRHHMGMNETKARERTFDLLRLVGIGEPALRSRQFPYQLSGGMRQRVMIAMALACEPKLLIADEPTTALDVTIQLQILDLLGTIQQKLGLSIILITHDLGVVARVCDRVMVMYGGKIVENGPVAEIFSAPGHPYTKALISATPTLREEQARLVSIDGMPPSLITPPKGCSYSERCPRSEGVCTRSDPSLEPVQQGHSVACWMADSSPESNRETIHA